jgi:hypothetical protein
MAKTTKMLKEEFKSTAALEVQNLKQKEEIAALQAVVTKLLAKIDEMQGLDLANLINRGFSPEQEIVEIQIERLQALSRERQLTLDETRTLDLHLKNKRLIDKDARDALDAEFRDLSEDDLMDILEDDSKTEETKQIPARKAAKTKKS